jgi:dihydrodipicolinate synthase/N-acetylneuraminate lyase
MSETWRGIMPIVATPFTRTYELDEAGLKNLVRYCIDAGATGLVGPANASEFSTLSDDERRRWIDIVVGEAAGQVPVIASVTSGHALPAVALSCYAQRVGAAGIMSMPPHILHPDAEGCYAFYDALDSAVDIPICVQNFNHPIGTPMSAEILARMCAELRHVDYIKEETSPEPRQISRTLAAATQGCLGVLGGQGGIYLIDEFRRGSCGNMPGCHTTDILVDIWRNLEEGQEGDARRLFNQLLPLMNYERLYGVAVYKLILHRRGLIDTPLRRAPGGDLDSFDMVELEKILPAVEALFRV